MYESPYNLCPTMDDFGNSLIFYTVHAYWSWVYSTCTYGSFGYGANQIEYSANI